MLLSLYLAVLDDQSKEEQFIDVYNTYKRLAYHTAYKIMGDSYLAEEDRKSTRLNSSHSV